MSNREMISEASMKGIDTSSYEKSDGVIDINNVEFITRVDQQPASKNKKENKKWLWFIIILIIIVIILLLLDFYNIIQLGIFNNKSTFINTCINAII